MKFIDPLLNRITMYRLVLYVLIGLLFIGEIFSFFHLLPFSPLALFFSTFFLLIVCVMTNKIFALFFNVPTNIESVYISALILALIITPTATSFISLFFAGIFTIASKFLVALNKKHIFNPVAFGVFFGGLLTGNYASWWVGTASLLPFVIVGGFLIVRKIRREDMIFTFFVVAVATIFGFDIIDKANPFVSFEKIIFETPMIFFASVMLTEPLTTPPTTTLQVIYASFVGFLYAPQVHLFNFYTTPETALLLGNIFSYIASPKVRVRLELIKKVALTKDIYDFIFRTSQQFTFLPGQYMEWTLPHKSPDSRGNRRYFTIASSPTEKEVILGVRFNPNGSSFKNSLHMISQKDSISASHISGDFTLPKDGTKKLVFIAGGIGVTPFRSMVKYLVDTKEKRDIIVVYTAKNPDEFVYKNIFDQAGKVGIRVIYTITNTKDVPKNWQGHVGRISGELVQEKIPDFAERIFYLSGPNTMIESFEKTLRRIGVKHIKKDYFPGFS